MRGTRSRLLRRYVHYVLASFFLMVLGASSIESSPGYTFEKGHWYGQSYEGHPGRFSHCVVSLHNEEHQVFLIKLTVDRQVALGISDLSWSVAESQTVPTKVIFDHTLIYDGPSIAISKDVFYLELKNAHASLKRMQSAKMALFELKEQSIFFELAGVEDAVGALIDCVKQGQLNMKDT